MHSKKDTLSPQTDKKTVQCPQCRQKTPFNPNNPYRPFCSERCKKIDLGAWASDVYAIPGEAAPQTTEPFQDPADHP